VAEVEESHTGQYLRHVLPARQLAKQAVAG
jgi:hypothetical protein